MTKAQEALNEAHEELNRLNNRMLELEENNYKIKLRAFVVLTSYFFEVYSKNDIKNDKLWFGLDIDSEDVIKSKKRLFLWFNVIFCKHF